MDDKNGNLMRKLAKSGGESWRYVYDAESMMVEAQKWPNPTEADKPYPDIGKLLLKVTHSYDAFGRRVRKTVYEGAYGNTLREDRAFLYHNEDIIAEYTYNPSTYQWTLDRSTLHGPGIDEPVATTSSGTMEFYHSDGLGSVTDLSNPAAAETGTARYSSFGSLSASEAFTPRYSYTAREGPEESGYYYYRQRYYDSATGRFTSGDPIRVRIIEQREPMSIRLFQKAPIGWHGYVYADQSPPNRIDPTGELAIAGAAVAGMAATILCKLCADPIFQANKNTKNEATRHCVSSCQVSNKCSPFCSLWLGYGLEIAQTVLPGAGVGDPNDLNNNNRGLGCSLSGKSCGSCCDPPCL